MKGVGLACFLSLAVLGLYAQSVDTFKIIPVPFEDVGSGRGTKAKIPKDWKLVAVEHVKVNESQLWFIGPTGSILMVSGFLDTDNSDPREPQFVLTRTVNEIQVEK